VTQTNFVKLTVLVSEQLTRWKARSQAQQVAKNLIRIMARDAQQEIARLSAPADQSEVIPMPRALLQGLVDAWNKEDNSPQGSPDHCHTEPGIWDSDWADGRAGQPCTECALYDQARALLEGK